LDLSVLNGWWFDSTPTAISPDRLSNSERTGSSLSVRVVPRICSGVAAFAAALATLRATPAVEALYPQENVEGSVDFCRRLMDEAHVVAVP